MCVFRRGNYPSCSSSFCGVTAFPAVWSLLASGTIELRKCDHLDLVLSWTSNSAGHILYDMSEGTRYCEPTESFVPIGVIPNGAAIADFRYFANIVAHDIHKVDACLLKIMMPIEREGRMEGEGNECCIKTSNPVPEMQHKFDLNKLVHIVGFSHEGGEGVQEHLEHGYYGHHSVEITKGFICKVFKSATCHWENVSSIHSSSATKAFVPREEIVGTRGATIGR